jgi:hypothetical protein
MTTKKKKLQQKDLKNKKQNLAVDYFINLFIQRLLNGQFILNSKKYTKLNIFFFAIFFFFFQIIVPLSFNQGHD